MGYSLQRYTMQHDHKRINLDEMITEPDSVYHAKRGEYLSSHALAEYRDCPFRYFLKREGVIEDNDSTAYAFGRAAHTRILEGVEAFTKNYVFGGPINERTGKPYGEKTKAFQEWQAEQDKQVISMQDVGKIEDMAKQVELHSEAHRLLQRGVPEKVARVTIQDIDCQIRCDWMHPEKGLVDLKTCESLTWFEKDMKRFGYIFQMAFYRMVLEAYFGVEVDVHIIAVEKQAPHRVGVWHILPNVLDHAEKINRIAMKSLKRSLDDGYWPTGFEQVRQIEALA